jgi:hypothetical protein
MKRPRIKAAFLLKNILRNSFIFLILILNVNLNHTISKPAVINLFFYNLAPHNFEPKVSDLCNLITIRSKGKMININFVRIQRF